MLAANECLRVLRFDFWTRVQRLAGKVGPGSCFGACRGGPGIGWMAYVIAHEGKCSAAALTGSGPTGDRQTMAPASAQYRRHAV